MKKGNSIMIAFGKHPGMHDGDDDGGGMHEGDRGYDEEQDGPSEEEVHCAEELKHELEEGDPEGIAMALKNFIRECMKGGEY